MKKRSRWILILSALLCLCMLFASCQSGNDPQDENGAPETLPEEAVPENEKVEYGKIVAEWTKYLKYESSTKGGSVKAEKFFGYNTNLHDVDSYGGGFYVRAEVVNGENSYDVFNEYTGKKIIESLVGNYQFYGKGCILQIRRTEKDAENNDVYQYDYFDSNGEKINAEPLTEAAQIQGDYSAGTYSVLDRGYQVRDGRIVATYKAGQEIAFPEAAEYNENKYVFEGGNVKVYDKNNKKIAEASFEGTENPRPYILSNGNVLMSASYSLPKDADKYTYEVDDQKFDLAYRVLDIKTGEVTEIPATFVIDLMITPAEANRELNLATVGKDYQFAQIRKITDGRLEAVADYVVLSDALAITAELPKIVKNQTGIYGALDANTLIIKTETGELSYDWMGTTNDERWLYSVDLTTGSTELYANLNKYTEIDGGFIYYEIEQDHFYGNYEYAVYDSNMNKLSELPENCRIEVEDGMVFVRDTSGEDTNWKLLTIESGQVKLRSVDTDSLSFDAFYTVDDGSVFVIDGRFYNNKGEFLFDAGEGYNDYYDVIGAYSDNIVVKTFVNRVVTYYTVG